MPVHLSPRSRKVAAVALASVSLVAAAALAAIFLSSAFGAWTAISATGPAQPADGILLVAGMGGALLSLWLGLGLTLSALGALPGALGQVCSQLAGRVAPVAVRKVVAFVLGTTLTAALVPGTVVGAIGRDTVRPAVVATAEHVGKGLGATPDASFRILSRSTAGRDAPAVRDAAPPPAWSPMRPGRPDKAEHPQTTERPDKTVVVLRGDTLWSIATDHLDPAASAADVDAEWHRWFAANREVIGDDPNLVLPGQLLRPPPASGAGQ